MAQVTIGATTFTEQPEKSQKVKGKGWLTTRTWFGPRAGADEFVQGSVIPLNPDDIDVTKGTPAIVTATFADSVLNSFASDPLQEAEDEAVWELIPSVLDKTLATHPAFGAYNGAAGINVIELIEKALRDGTANATDWDGAWGVQNMNDYRNLRIKGVDSWRTWGYTIRKTISVGKTVDVQAEEVNTQKIVEYAEIGLPDDIKWSQPTYRRWDNVQAQSIPINEWLASPPQIRFRGKKYEITKEWVGAVRWYAVMYEDGSALTTQDGN